MGDAQRGRAGVISGGEGGARQHAWTKFLRSVRLRFRKKPVRAPPRHPRPPFSQGNPAMSSVGAAPRAAVHVSSARAEASRQNGARSRGPQSEEGRARSVQNALKHGMRAQKYLVLPDEDAAEFAGLEAALVEELAPVGALQTVLARRGAVAAWRLMRGPVGRRVGAPFPTRRPTDRAVRGAPELGRRARARPDPRRQRPPLVRDGWREPVPTLVVGASCPLSRRGHGRVLARAPHAQGAPGRAGAKGRKGAPGRVGGRNRACPRMPLVRTAARPPLATLRNRTNPSPTPSPDRITW